MDISRPKPRAGSWVIDEFEELYRTSPMAKICEKKLIKEGVSYVACNTSISQKPTPKAQILKDLMQPKDKDGFTPPHQPALKPVRSNKLPFDSGVVKPFSPQRKSPVTKIVGSPARSDNDIIKLLNRPFSPKANLVRSPSSHKKPTEVSSVSIAKTLSSDMSEHFSPQGKSSIEKSIGKAVVSPAPSDGNANRLLNASRSSTATIGWSPSSKRKSAEEDIASKVKTPVKNLTPEFLDEHDLSKSPLSMFTKRSRINSGKESSEEIVTKLNNAQENESEDDSVNASVDKILSFRNAKTKIPPADPVKPSHDQEDKENNENVVAEMEDLQTMKKPLTRADTKKLHHVHMEIDADEHVGDEEQGQEAEYEGNPEECVSDPVSNSEDEDTGPYESTPIIQPHQHNTRGHVSKTSVVIKENLKVLKRWYIQIARGGKISVEGYLLDSDTLWHSSAIVERIASRTLRTGSGGVYKLDGGIDKKEMRLLGFPNKIITAFQDGFPADWNNLLQSVYNRWLTRQQSKDDKSVKKGSQDKKSSSKRSSSTAAEEPSNGKQRKRSDRKLASTKTGQENLAYQEKLQDSLFKPQLRCRKARQNLDLSNLIEASEAKSSLSIEDLPTTRSGRRIKPTLAWWTGQRIIVDAKTGKTNITSESPNLLRGSAMYNFQSSFTEQQNWRLNASVDKNNKKSKSVAENKKAPVSNSKSEKRGRKTETRKRSQSPDVNSSVSNESASQRKTVRSRKSDTQNVSRTEKVSQVQKKSSSVKSSEQQKVETSKGKQLNSIEHFERSDDEEEPWTKEEIQRLVKAMKETAPSSNFFWHKIAKQVKSRTPEECAQYHYKNAPESAKKKSRSSKVKDAEPLKLTGGVGTMKRKQQLRRILEHRDEGHKDDMFDSTPLRSKQLVNVGNTGDSDSDGEFYSKLPGTTYQTPTVRSTWVPGSEKKTPGNNFISPGLLRSVDRNAADQCMNRIMKNRKGRGRARTETSNKTPARPKPGKSVTLSQVSNTFTVEAETDGYSSEDQDYYWSDASN